MSNRFAVFQSEEEEQEAGVQQRAPVKETKKVVVKKRAPKQADQAEEGEFQNTTDRVQSARGGRGGRGGDRGGRGGRGGDRGGRGGGDRPYDAERRGGRGGDRGDRGSRGRGGRGRGDDDGSHRYQGKPREEAHPFDRKSGTGRGKRDQQKGGHGKGNWGSDKAPVDGEEQPRQEEETKEQPERRPEPEQVESEEEEGFTFADYLAQKSESSTLAKKEGRGHEKMNMKGVAEKDFTKENIQTIDSVMTADATHAMVRGEKQELLGFKAGKDDDEFMTRGGRGGRGGRGRGGDRDRGAPREARGGRGGRRGGKFVVDDNDFPTL